MDWLSESVGLLLSGDHLTEPSLPGWAVLLAALLLMAIPLGPAEATAAATGIVVTTGVLSLSVLVPVVAAGMLAGDLVTFYAGGTIVNRLARRHRHTGWLERWHHALDTRSAWRDTAVVALRFIPGARTPAALAARSTGISTGRFTSLTALGCILWAGLWTTLGTLLPSPWAVPVLAGLLIVLAGTPLGLARRARIQAGRRLCLSASGRPANLAEPSDHDQKPP